MKRVVYFAAIASLALTAPAFAGSGHGDTQATTVQKGAVPASVRLNKMTFDLRPEAPSNVKPVAFQGETVFATAQEVTFDEYTFNLK